MHPQSIRAFGAPWPHAAHASQPGADAVFPRAALRSDGAPNACSSTDAPRTWRKGSLERRDAAASSPSSMRFRGTRQSLGRADPMMQPRSASPSLDPPNGCTGAPCPAPAPAGRFVSVLPTCPRMAAVVRRATLAQCSALELGRSQPLQPSAMPRVLSAKAFPQGSQLSMDAGLNLTMPARLSTASAVSSRAGSPKPASPKSRAARVEAPSGATLTLSRHKPKADHDSSFNEDAGKLVYPSSPGGRSEAGTSAVSLGESSPCSPCRCETADVSTAHEFVFSWLGWSPDKKSPCWSSLHRHFEGALPSKAVLFRSSRALASSGLTLENVRYAEFLYPSSIGFDSGNLSDSMRTNWCGNECSRAQFHGTAGFKKFCRQAPARDAVFLMFGPHVWLAPTGEVTKVRFWCSEEAPQRSIPKGVLLTPAFAMEAYQQVREAVNEIAELGAGLSRLVFLGGVHIHMPAGFEDHFMPLIFEIRSPGKDAVNFLSIFRCDAPAKG